jgi:hypothetical protein
LTLTLFVSSCTREYICQCRIKYTGNPPGLPDSSTQEFMIRDTKDEAFIKCEANSVLITENGITFDQKCRIY